MNLNLHCIQITFIIIPMSIIFYVDYEKEVKLKNKARNLIQHNNTYMIKDIQTRVGPLQSWDPPLSS
jgi:hypothetical protein